MNPSASQEMSSISGSSYSQNNIDDDIDELLRCFGPANSDEFAPNIDFSDVELDKNLSEILEDLQKVKTESGENNNSQFAGCHTLPDDPINSLWNIQKNIELEEERLEKLRKPRFQTLPAYKKRAKQETQWIEAVHAAKNAVSPNSELEEFIGIDFNSDLPAVTDGGGVEVISGVEDELEDVTSSSRLVSPKAKVSTCIELKADLPLVKSNNLVNTEKHLSSDNHFPANSRIFNRSLEELQCTANAISQTFLEKERTKAKRTAPKSSSSGSQSPSNNKRRKVENSRSILVKNNNNKTPVRPEANKNKKIDIYNSVWIPARQERLEKLQALPVPISNVHLNHVGLPPPPPPPPPPLIPLRSPNVRVRAMNVYKTPLVPLARAPVLPSPRHVKLPISGIQQNKACLLLNLNSTNPIVLNKTQILQKISSKPQTFPPPGTTVGKSCHNCQKLNSYLPFLGYKFRKHQGALRRNTAGESLVLLCELCGSFVRESVIYGEEMSLSHVSAAHYPKFFNNSDIEMESRATEESQNYISISM